MQFCKFSLFIYLFVGKIGYGTVSESLAYNLPFIFVRRDYFNEEPFLRNMLEVEQVPVELFESFTTVYLFINASISFSCCKQYYQGGVEMIRRDLLTGSWTPYLERALTLKPCYEADINGGEVRFYI